jgi:hypothetical protein
MGANEEQLEMFKDEIRNLRKQVEFWKKKASLSADGRMEGGRGLSRDEMIEGEVVDSNDEAVEIIKQNERLRSQLELLKQGTSTLNPDSSLKRISSASSSYMNSSLTSNGSGGSYMGGGFSIITDDILDQIDDVDMLKQIVQRLSYESSTAFNAVQTLRSMQNGGGRRFRAHIYIYFYHFFFFFFFFYLLFHFTYLQSFAPFSTIPFTSFL